MGKLMQISAAIAVYAQATAIYQNARANPICSADMEPSRCAELQIAEVSKIFAQYRTDTAQLQDQLTAARREIATLKDQVTALQNLASTIDSETKPVRPGGQACLFTRFGDVPVGWKDRGTFGVIQEKTTGDAYQRGGDFNPGWWWQHGRFACGR